MILEQFDQNENAIINPWDLNDKIEGFPEIFISCFARETFKRMVMRFNAKQIEETSCANLVVPIYEFEYKGLKLGLMNSYVGAAGCVGMLEDLYAMGMKKLIIFGTCGVLNHDIDDVSIIVPDFAVRDEGTSYHYQPASDEISVNDDTLEDFISYLKEQNISYTKGKVWTTDGIYRETIDKMNKRKASGCIAVDMECSAVSAWAKLRKLKVLHFFYAADKLSEEGWDERSLSNNSALDEKDIIADIAINFAKYI